MKKRAFTLAEILITLVMIGVVSSLTIPSLINNISEQQNKVAWRKAFSDLSQATQRIVFDNGGSLKGVFSNHDAILTTYLRYFNYTKLCNEGTSNGNCWHRSFKHLSGNTDGSNWSSSAAILANGMLFYDWLNNSDYSYTSEGPARCGVIVIDVNGFSNPNTYGKDIFLVHLLEDRIKPYGIPEDNTNCVSTSSGRGCAALYLYQ